jgi:hypothetical protein
MDTYTRYAYVYRDRDGNLHAAVQHADANGNSYLDTRVGDGHTVTDADGYRYYYSGGGLPPERAIAGRVFRQFTA